MYGGDSHAAIAKAAATVTHIQSNCQEVGFGDEGLGSFGFDSSSAETDSLCFVHRGSSQDRIFSLCPRRWLSLSSRAKELTLQGRHIGLVSDFAFHTSLRGALLLVRWYLGCPRDSACRLRRGGGMVGWGGWCSQVCAPSELQFGALRDGGGTREAGSTVAEDLVVRYRVSTRQIRRRRRAARSSTSQRRAEPLCARIKGVNREASDRKADV